MIILKLFFGKINKKLKTVNNFYKSKLYEECLVNMTSNFIIRFGNVRGELDNIVFTHVIVERFRY